MAPPMASTVRRSAPGIVGRDQTVLVRHDGGVRGVVHEGRQGSPVPDESPQGRPRGRRRDGGHEPSIEEPGGIASHDRPPVRGLRPPVDPDPAGPHPRRHPHRDQPPHRRPGLPRHPPGKGRDVGRHQLRPLLDPRLPQGRPGVGMGGRDPDLCGGDAGEPETACRIDPASDSERCSRSKSTITAAVPVARSRSARAVAHRGRSMPSARECDAAPQLAWAMPPGV